MDKLETEIFNKYLEIKQDIVNNLKEVFNKEHTYTHKYRGNIILDVNVSLREGRYNERIIQIFVRAKGKWIKEVLTLHKGNIFNSKINTNLYEE